MRVRTSRNERLGDDYITLNPRVGTAPANTPDASYTREHMHHGSQESTVQGQDSAMVMDQSYTNMKTNVDVEWNQ